MSSPTLNLQLSLVGSVAGSPPIAGSTSLAESVNLQQLLQLLPGTGGGQADTVYQTTGTIAASGTATVDLNGSVTDVFGATVNLLHVKAIILLAAAGNTNDVQIGPGAANPFTGPFGGTTPYVAVSPGEMFMITKGSGAAAGWGVTASTADILKLANSGGGSSVTYTLVVIGTST
jgi:hypothetical protein